MSLRAEDEELFSTDPLAKAALEDEFAFIENDAQDLGVVPLEVERVLFPLSSGGHVSGLQWGRGELRWIALHGAGLHAHSFDKVALALGQPGLALDLPGHGHSSWRTDRDYRPETTAASLAEILSHHLAGGVPVIGHSMGGLVAAALAAEHPVSHLVLLDILPSSGRSPKPSGARVMFRGPSRYASFAEVAERAVRAGLSKDTTSALRGIVLNTVIEPDGTIRWRHHLADGPSNHERDPRAHENGWAALQKLGSGCLLVWGKRGVLDESIVLSAADRCPNIILHQLDTAHNVHHESPMETASAIRQLLRPAGDKGRRSWG